MDPPVSDPSETIASSAATTAADPPLDPPGIVSRSHGFRVVKKAEFSVEDPMANSSILVLPIITALCDLSFCITVASYGDTKFPRIRDPQVVKTSWVQMTSFKAIGIPVKGEVWSP